MTCVVLSTTDYERLQRAEQSAKTWQFFTGLMACSVVGLGILLCEVGTQHDRMAEKVVRQELAIQR
jgi:hypothetical protein